jgi:hypothetical protein
MNRDFSIVARRCVAAIILSMSAAAARADVEVDLRQGGGSVRADSATGDLGGLTVRGPQLWSDEGALSEPYRGAVLPWDMVREVRGDSAGIGDFLAIGEDLWRARIRIERGDEALAQPILAKHWARFRDAEGPTAALAAEGLLRVALANGDIRAAAEPWLACLRHRSAGIASRFPGLPAAFDADNGLLPVLSPFMPESRRADLIAACDAARASGEAGDVARLVVRIARGEVATGAGEAAGATKPSDAAKSDGTKSDGTKSDGTKSDGTKSDGTRTAPPSVRALSLLADISGAADARVLERAVGAFDRAFDEPPSYLAAWRLAAIGTCRARLARALPADAARASALGRAALDLLAVPAAGLDASGLVDAYALEEAGRLLREAGDDASASQLDALAREKVKDSTRSMAR